MPNDIWPDSDGMTLHVGHGEICPVPPPVWNYEVSGMQVVKKWFRYRQREPAADDLLSWMGSYQRGGLRN